MDMSNQIEQIPAEIEREMQEIAERAPSDFCHYSDIVDREEWCKEKFRHFFAAGMLAERERLMAGAVKTNIFDVEDGTDAAKLIVRIPGAKTGDEVYIIKEEGK